MRHCGSTFGMPLAVAWVSMPVITKPKQRLADIKHETAVQMRATGQSVEKIAKEVDAAVSTVTDWFLPYDRFSPKEGRKKSPLKPVPAMIQARLQHVLNNAPKSVGISLASLMIDHQAIIAEARDANQYKAALDGNALLMRMITTNPDLSKAIDAKGEDVTEQTPEQLMADLGGDDET